MGLEAAGRIALARSSRGREGQGLTQERRG